MRRNSESGFTLVELLIVVTILGVIAGLVMPRVGDALHKAKILKAQQEMATITRAWMSMGAVLGQGQHFPTGSILNVEATFPIQVSAGELEAFLETEVPEHDPWGNLYDYRVDRFPSRCLLIRTANSDGLFSTEYTVGQMISAPEKQVDLVITDPRWIVGLDWFWRRGTIPIPIPINPPPFSMN